MTVPLQHEVDTTNPEEAFVWALACLPGPKDGVLPIPPQVLGKWSKHLWDLGFRHYPEDQKREYQPPARGGDHWLNATGKWVKKGTPMPARATAPDMSKSTPDERADVVRQLIESGELEKYLPKSAGPDTAQIASFEGLVS